MWSYTRSDRHTEQCTAIHKVDVFLIALFIILIILHVISLSYVVSKNHEVVEKFDPEHQVVSSDDDFCIFFINADHPTGNKKACNFVIYGSGVLAGCALLMITFLVVRIGYFSIKLVIAITSSCITRLAIGSPAN